MSDAIAPSGIQALHADSPEYQRLVDAASGPLHQAFGTRVALKVSTLDLAGAWAFLLGNMQAPGGGRPDYAQTAYAGRAAQGGMSDTYVALLKRTDAGSRAPDTESGDDPADGAWRLVDHAIGPSDVAWLTWPRKHGAPTSLLGLKPRP